MTLDDVYFFPQDEFDDWGGFWMNPYVYKTVEHDGEEWFVCTPVSEIALTKFPDAAFCFEKTVAEIKEMFIDRDYHEEKPCAGLCIHELDGTVHYELFPEEKTNG
ncbi:MAG TPA: hypothetical protein VG097_11780 [Gemmata sp.]|nr:hypothetical protein [Gemmata sp.]